VFSFSHSVLYNFGIAGTPWILGRDIAGVVERVGGNVQNVVPGERVWLCADSRDVRSGAYQAYSIARGAHVGKICENVSNEEAATLGTGLVTAAIAAYWFFDWNRALSLGGKAMPRLSRMDEDGPLTNTGRKWVL
jgi:NADPH:quinone reductase-like Zn-dependent oxidoreductase